MRLTFMFIASTLFMGCAEVENFDNKSEEVDLKSLAKLIVTNNLTEEEYNDLGLSEDEFKELMFEVGILSGGDPDGLMDWIYGAEPDNSSLYRGACQQNLEKANLSGYTLSLSHYNDTWCDGDGSDVDWVFTFNPSWMGEDPDNMKWWSTNWWVRQVFSSPSPLYNGLLLGSSLCTSPLQVCLGTNGVSAAGGVNTVANSLVLTH